MHGTAGAHRERGAHVRRAARGLGVDAGDREPLEQEWSDGVEPGAGLHRRWDARQVEAAQLPEHLDFLARVVQEVGPGGDHQGRQPDREGIVVVGVRVGRRERRLPVRE